MKIQLKEISKSFSKDQAVLQNISLDFPEGGIFCLLGKNGAGKSTLIHLLMQLLQPDQGDILYDGISYKELPNTIKQRIGLLGENNFLIEELSGLQFLKLSAKLYKVAPEAVEKRIEDLNNYFFEAGQLKKKVASYSTGMKKKLGLCAAVLHTPDLLILDEPFSGLDPVATEMTSRFIKSYSKTGRTVFLSSHNLNYIEKVATHLAVLHEGTIVFQGTPEAFTKEGKEKLDDALINLLSPASHTLNDIEWI